MRNRHFAQTKRRYSCWCCTIRKSAFYPLIYIYLVETYKQRRLYMISSRLCALVVDKLWPPVSIFLHDLDSLWRETSKSPTMYLHKQAEILRGKIRPPFPPPNKLGLADNTKRKAKAEKIDGIALVAMMTMSRRMRFLTFYLSLSVVYIYMCVDDTIRTFGSMELCDVTNI